MQHAKFKMQKEDATDAGASKPPALLAKRIDLGRNHHDAIDIARQDRAVEHVEDCRPSVTVVPLTLPVSAQLV
jgi:hypothetical protein